MRTILTAMMHTEFTNVFSTKKFSELPFDEKEQLVEETLRQLKELRKMTLGTKTAETIWKERVDYNISFYEKLKAQLENSLNVC